VRPLADRKPQKGSVNLIRELTLAGAAGEATFPRSWGYAIPEEWKPLEQVYNIILSLNTPFASIAFTYK
jgi:hypothetical protein